MSQTQALPADHTDPASSPPHGTALDATYRRIAWRLVPFLVFLFILAWIDRVNVGFAKLSMLQDLQFSEAVYGLGAGIFFIGYFLFEVPSNLLLEKIGARKTLARITILWGLASMAMIYVKTPASFYALRFLLGIFEAGFFPGVVLYLTYWFPGARRTKMVALFMTAIAISNAVGSPVSGAIMQYMDGANGWRGWQWLFLVEGAPARGVRGRLERGVERGQRRLAVFERRPAQVLPVEVEEVEAVLDLLGVYVEGDDPGHAQGFQHLSNARGGESLAALALMLPAIGVGGQDEVDALIQGVKGESPEADGGPEAPADPYAPFEALGIAQRLRASASSCARSSSLCSPAAPSSSVKARNSSTTGLAASTRCSGWPRTPSPRCASVRANDGNGPADVRAKASEFLEDCPNQYPPMRGAVESLNVSVASGICLYEAVRQRG